MEKIELQILGITSGQSATSYTLILEEVNGQRKLPVIIGAFEAQAIAIEIEKITPARPMTHDLFRNMAKDFNISIREVVIHQLHEGVFYANLVCVSGSEVHEIDARTSDAIALALRFDCPIYTHESIMQEAGVVLNEIEMEGRPEKGPKKPKKSKTDLTQYNSEELEQMLENALDEENYILAAKIRDELKARGGASEDE